LNSKHCHQNGYQLWEFGANFFTSTTKHHVHNIFHACIRGSKTHNKQNPPVTKKNSTEKIEICEQNFAQKSKEATKTKRVYIPFCIVRAPCTHQCHGCLGPLQQCTAACTSQSLQYTICCISEYQTWVSNYTSLREHSTGINKPAEKGRSIQHTATL
jgi:hypothetical protein